MDGFICMFLWPILLFAKFIKAAPNKAFHQCGNVSNNIPSEKGENNVKAKNINSNIEQQIIQFKEISS